MSEPAQSPKEAMEKLLNSMGQLGASDLHLKVGYAPYYRIAKHLRKVDLPPLSDSNYVEQMIADLIPDAHKQVFESGGDIDFSTTGANGDRYRINAYRSMAELSVAIRRVQNNIPTFEDLSLPEIYAHIAGDSLDGLILVAGVTGSGKSSTLAAIMEHINQTRSLHILTIEDPVEYVFQAKKSIISQREIGIDIPTYEDALRFMVRQDPDCIFIGEMRDRETMLAAIQAAETGHLVLGSLHSSDAPQTFSRILEFFPRHDHAFIRSSLAASLRAILCQKLLPGIEEGSQYPATEVLLINSITRDKILHEEDDALSAIIAQCKDEGMRSFTSSLCELIETEKVHYDTAMDHAPNKEALASAVKGIKTASQGLVGRSRS